MSIALELSRIQTDRNTIRTKLVELGLAGSSDNLDKLASAIEKIINREAVSATVKEGETYTIPAGYHNGTGTVSGVSGGGNYNLQSKTVTPTKSQQSITSDDGYYGLSDITVKAIPNNYQDVSSVNALAEEVLTGKVYVTSDGTVTAGTMTNNGTVNKTLDGTTVTYTIPKGFHSGLGTVKLVIEQKTATPTKTKQEIVPSPGKVLSKVIIEPIPDDYITTIDATATAAQILIDETAYVNSTKITGTMPNNGDVSKTIDGLTITNVSIPSGYTTGGTINLTGDIEQQLAAI